MCVAVVLFCVAFCSVFAFRVRVLWSICGVFVVGAFSATTFGRCLGSDAFHMTRLTVFSTCCVVVRLVGWFVVVCVVVRRASCRFHLCFIGCVVGICVCIGCVLRQFPRATRARHTCDTCATHVRHRCGACTTCARHMRDTGATHVRPMCDHHATHVRPMCDPCATTMRHTCDPCATHVRPPCDHHATHVRHRCGTGAAHARPCVSVMINHHFFGCFFCHVIFWGSPSLSTVTILMCMSVRETSCVESYVRGLFGYSHFFASDQTCAQ